tara:strand:- start:37655 stop:38101 length:447 start_codon:yes stop_codon:yes gene_type:complete
MNSYRLERDMSVPRSFINYMKIMREYYKSGATRPDPLPKDFNFNDIEVDASSYGFISNDNFNESINNTNNNNNNLKNNKIPMSSNDQVLPAKAAPQTEITTIDLFQQNDRLKNLGQQPPTQKKITLILSKKVNGIFATMMASFSQESK